MTRARTGSEIRLRTNTGWNEPCGSRQHFGTLLLGYYTDDGKLHYAGRAGTGFTETELKRMAGVLRPLEVKRMPLDKPPPRETRFGSPLELSRVHWVRPQVVVEVTYLAWTEGGLAGGLVPGAAGGQAK
jgi:ATP-dependent DNA ligase